MMVEGEREAFLLKQSFQRDSPQRWDVLPGVGRSDRSLGWEGKGEEDSDMPQNMGRVRGRGQETTLL